MALSSSEHELLVGTCDNMNVAAATCREVLEMLRNLGNTGVVDIATHNNSQGAHSGDETILHIASTYADGYGQQVDLGKKNGLSKNPLVVRASPKVFSQYIGTYTNGNTNMHNTGASLEVHRYLSDNNLDRISFDTPISDTSEFPIWHHINYIYDSSDNNVRAGLTYYAGDFNHSVSSGIDPYACIRPFVTNGSYNAFSFVLEISGIGIEPDKNNVFSLGTSAHAWKDAFLVNAPTVTSDGRIKKDISALGSQAVDFIKALRPVSYRLKQGEGQADQFNDDGLVPNDTPDREGVRTHWGLIAQEVKEALSTAGYEDAAVWCLTNRDDPDSQQSLRYEELIAPMIKVIQQQQERIEALERKVA